MVATEERTRTRIGLKHVLPVVVVGGVLAVIGLVGYDVIEDKIRPAPATNPPAETQRIWEEEYTAEYERERENLPSRDEMRRMRDTCIDGLPGAGARQEGNPGYAPTDANGRAVAAWVCLNGSPMKVDDERCEWPTGTTEATYRGSWVRGHLVSFKFGGDGLKRDNGGCVDIVPQTGSINKRISDGPEAYALAHAADRIFLIAVAHYRTDDSLPPPEAAKPDRLYYFIFGDEGDPIQAWLFENR